MIATSSYSVNIDTRLGRCGRILQMSENVLLIVLWKVSIFPTCLHILQINFFDVFKNLSLGLYILAENLRSISIVKQIRQNISSQI